MIALKAPHIVIAGVLGLALLGGGFAMGMTLGRGTAATPEASATSSGGGRGGTGGTGAFVGRFGQGGTGAQVLSGRVLSVNDGSITVELRSGGGQSASPGVSSQIVLVGGSTHIVRTTEQDIKTGDLKVNDQIQIVGTTDASGNVSATAIVVGGNALQQLLGGGGPAGGGRGASPSPSPSPKG